MTVEFEVRQGDLFNHEHRYIAHGCNTVGQMGAGFARIVHEKMSSNPKDTRSFDEYVRQCKTGEFTLGSVLFLPVDRGNPDTPVIVNLGTQRGPGRCNGYRGIQLSFMNLMERCNIFGITEIAMPAIGCGIGGLHWPTVRDVIDGACSGQDVSNHLKLIVYKL